MADEGASPLATDFDEEVLGRQRRLVGWLGLAAAVVFVVVAIFAFTELARVEAQIEARRAAAVQIAAEVLAKQAELDEAKGALAKLETDKSRLQSEVAELEAKRHMLATVASWVGAEAPTVQREAMERYAADHPAVAGQLGRVYLHIARPSQRATADVLTEALVKAGFVVPGVELLPDISPVSHQLRYFRVEDAPAAQAVAAALQVAGVKLEAVQIRLPAGQRLPPAGQFEVWLGRR